jgi:hypothetical protein
VKIHLDGFGMLGCALGVAFDRAGVDWTWSIPMGENLVRAAWPASTGAIYPAGSPDEVEARTIWVQRWQLQSAFVPHIERGEWWFSTKAPPHGAPGPIREEVGKVRRTNQASLHLNVQAFVSATRAMHARRRVVEAPKGAHRVRAHGFAERLHHVVWGWAAVARLRYDDRFNHNTSLRPAFSLRADRFTTAYAYPRPGTNQWYVGSSMIRQKVAADRDPTDALLRWQGLLADLTGGLVTAQILTPPTQGWRPAPAPADQPYVREVGGVLCVRPMGASGVRLAPLVVRDVLDALNLR